ncbi:hypothetical protein ACP70R_030494 [Stipagrostis hirtigluma subsp. patula]
MAAPATAATALSMKLLVDTKTQRVLFAEAGKDVVDFLFSLLTLPAATAVKLLGKESMVGSTGNLYASVEKLDGAYVLPGAAKDSLLRPTVATPAAIANSSIFSLPAPPPPPAQPKAFYRCTSTYSSHCRTYVADVYGKACPNCHNQMTVAAQYLTSSTESGQAAQSAAKGFVQGIVTYTVMDDLTVAPMSAISSITLLSTFAVRDLGDLQEKTVQLGYTEGLEILKASLRSKTVLTDVFLCKKGPGEA